MQFREATATISRKLSKRLTISAQPQTINGTKLTKSLHDRFHSYDGNDVSPIEETNNPLFIMNEPASEYAADQSRNNIPAMRRERRKNSAAASQASRGNPGQQQTKQPRPHGNDVRWDPRTGEPTVGEKGRPSQIDPHRYVENLSHARAPTGAPKQAGQQPVTPFGVRLKAAPRKTGSSPKAEPAPRPEWRGGSGRTALVEPVSDNKSITPLNIPRKSSKRAARGPGVLSPVESLDSETASPPPVRTAPLNQVNGRAQRGTPHDIVPSGQQVATRTGSQFDAQSYPTPPLSDDHSGPAKTSQPSRLQQHPLTPSSHPQTPQMLFPPKDKAIRRKPAGGAGHNPHRSVSSSVYSHQGTSPAAPPPADDWVQPPSRFSVTTYATSAHTASPRPSVDDAPPLPAPPRHLTESPQTVSGNSILDRKRPVVSGYEGSIRSQTSPEPIKINMDSMYYTPAAPRDRPSGPRPVPYPNHSTLSVTSVSSVDKCLPLAPPEQSARDRVTMLNAQIEALGNRRININHAIKQMTELMPTDNVLASEAVIRKRESEKRKVETLKLELADVQREEYELGLKLHRAYKRLDRDAEYEPTTLWVRRVTG